MATASVTVRVDEDTKRAAANIVEDFGFDLSSVTRAFYRQKCSRRWEHSGAESQLHPALPERR